MTMRYKQETEGLILMKCNDTFRLSLRQVLALEYLPSYCPTFFSPFSYFICVCLPTSLMPIKFGFGIKESNTFFLCCIILCKASSMIGSAQGKVLSPQSLIGKNPPPITIHGVLTQLLVPTHSHQQPVTYCPKPFP